MKLFKKIVDERQELELLRIERIGFWVLFWGLVIAVHVQLFLDDFDFRHIAGEFILLIIAAIVVVAGCIRKGLWSYSTNPTVKSNIFYSLAGALVFGAFSVLMRYKRSGIEIVDIGGFAIAFLIQTIIIFSAGFILLTICGAITNKRKAKIEASLDDNSGE